MIGSQRIKQVLSWPILANILGLVGTVIYFVQSVLYTFTQKSMIDEGLFLYKGYLFASGIYHPFQDYGPWMHKAPFAYLIPGYVQTWFGPGLRNGRYFAVLLSLLILLGLWLVTRRLAGNLWAAGVIWVIALNPALIKYYSIANSQGLTACLLVWTLFFALGEDRPTWQLILSSFLASILVFTRQNMLAVLPLLLGYILWQHGWRRAVWALIPSVAVFLILDVIYWPGILRMWAPLFPTQLTPFLNPWRAPRGVSASWDVRPSIMTQVASFFTGIRYHFTELAGGTAALLFWPRNTAWKSRSQYRIAVFLAAMFIMLTGIHLWVGTGNSDVNNYNAWAFSEYLAFFSWLGVLLVVISIHAWKEKISTWRQVFGGLSIVIASIGIGYSGFETFGYPSFNLHLPRIMSFFRTGHFLPGTVTVGQILGDKFGIGYNTGRWLVPTMIGLLTGMALIVVCFIIWRILRGRERTAMVYTFGSFVMIVFLIAGTILSPTLLLGGDFRLYDCGRNVIQSFEQTGHELAGIVSPGSIVYWDGGNAAAVLLYVPNIRIFPQQLDENWSFWEGGNADALARYGFWNEELMHQWQQEANIFIIQQSNFSSKWKQYLAPPHFEELNLDHVPLGCSPDSYLRIFIRE